jgi:hypothetical protein
MTTDRLIRIESRLVQIMLHLGMNPYQKAYEATNQHSTNSSIDTCGGEHTKKRPKQQKVEELN